jgi:hypothetical protein
VFRLLRFHFLFFVLAFSNFVGSQTILDDFTDGNYTANPVWSVSTGSASIVSTALSINASIVKISTPFTSVCNEWYIDLNSSSSSNTNRLRYYFILSNSSDPANASANGYCIEYSSTSGDIWLKRLDNGTTQSDASALGYYNGTAYLSSGFSTIKITRNSSDQFQIYVAGSLRITATDATYASSAVQYQSIWVTAANSYVWSIDNIKYTLACFDPTSAGTIANAQSSCGSFNPAAMTSSALPTGHSGTLEYKWQHSTTSSSTGFTDISSTNAVTYDPSTISQTTWYRRLARVSCSADWSGAATSNVIEMTITSPITITGNPVSDTVYNQTGNASFGIASNTTGGVSYQWQVSTDAGSTWSNLSNAGYYSGVTSTTLQVLNPITGMNSYRYRCIATNTCGSVNSNAAILYVLSNNSFINSTSAACGSWGSSSTASECLTRLITVSGIGTLNTTSNVLKQINLSLGSGSCTRNLSTYDFTLTSPSGTVYNFITDFSGTSTGVWVNIKFRDHVALEKVKEYSVPGNWFPYSIGYYAVDSDNSFASTFNSQNANGTWTFTMCEQSNVANNIAFNSVELVFGSKIQTNDVTSSSANNECSSAVCIGSDGVITIGTNNIYSSTDPNYPGNVVDGCDWNAANNNSAWFYFTASSTSAKINLSGIHNGASQIETQPIVFMRSGGCNSGTFTVPLGGCPNDETYNNSSYIGAQSAGSPYTAGISGNAEFNLTGLTTGQRYYLYVDGYGSAASTFYIEVPNGCETCNTPLPIELVSFQAKLENKSTLITWQTASERNNDYFTIERSANGTEWEVLESVKGAGFSNELLSYQTYDPYPLKGISYYRLKQTDYDGKFTYSTMETISNTAGVMVLPNPGSGLFFVSGLSERKESEIIVQDITGKEIIKIHSDGLQSQAIDLTQHPGGIYFVTINSEETIRIIKLRD